MARPKVRLHLDPPDKTPIRIDWEKVENVCGQSLSSDDKHLSFKQEVEAALGSYIGIEQATTDENFLSGDDIKKIVALHKLVLRASENIAEKVPEKAKDWIAPAINGIDEAQRELERFIQLTSIKEPDRKPMLTRKVWLELRYLGVAGYCPDPSGGDSAIIGVCFDRDLSTMQRAIWEIYTQAGIKTSNSNGGWAKMLRRELGSLARDS